jgi:acetylglutamate kinase
MNSDLTVFAALKESLFKKTPCVLSFFQEELLVTKIDAEKQKELKRKKKEQAAGNGSGKLKASLSALSAIPEYVASIESMEKQEIQQQKYPVNSQAGHSTDEIFSRERNPEC